MKDEATVDDLIRHLNVLKLLLRPAADTKKPGERKRPPTEAALLRHPKARAAVMSRAAATPSMTAAAKPGNSPLRLTVKAEATIAKPATTAARWVRVVVIRPA